HNYYFIYLINYIFFIYLYFVFFFFFFFFSSRRRHTRFSRDWSSDVCSSDLRRSARANQQFASARRLVLSRYCRNRSAKADGANRSEERRVGKECRYRW